MSKPIEEQNKIIAEFMGWYKPDKRCKDTKGRLDVPEEYWELLYDDSVHWECNHYEGWDELKFHFSWDWLMPVVEKIETMGYNVSIVGNECEIEEDYKRGSPFPLISYAEPTKIQAVLNAVYQFITQNHEIHQ